MLCTLVLFGLSPASLSADETTLSEFMSDYAMTFNEGDTQRLVDHFYDAPLSLVQNNQTTVMNDSNEVFEKIESMIVALGVRKGTITNIQDLSFCEVSDNLAFVKGNFGRAFYSGETIEMTYVYILRKYDQSFRIVSLIQSNLDSKVDCR